MIFLPKHGAFLHSYFSINWRLWHPTNATPIPIGTNFVGFGDLIPKKNHPCL